ncbi:MAG TPA: hypothetical protein VHS09_08560 [Polyangiaceae bacterium]|nr:hypothetical protein [Polyangiaceae bacterium]
MQVICFLLVAALTTATWSVLDWRRADTQRAHDLLVAWLRYVLAAWMFAFGFAKLIPSQMSLPDPGLLVMPYGESTRMKLLWTFMGTSPVYEQFAGGAELLGGLLLLARRTTALGALVCAGVLANVAMMNFCFDVPVKLDAVHLLLLSMFLALPSARRLVDTLVLGRAVPALDQPPLVATRWHRHFLALTVVFVAGILYTQAARSERNYYDARADGASLPEPYGVFDVEEMRRDGETVAPLLTDGTYWHRVYFGRLGAGVVYADGTRERLALPGSTRGAWTGTRGAFEVRHGEEGRLLVEGTLGEKAISVRARPTDPKNLLLLQRRSHWYLE